VIRRVLTAQFPRCSQQSPGQTCLPSCTSIASWSSILRTNVAEKVTGRSSVRIKIRRGPCVPACVLLHATNGTALSRTTLTHVNGYGAVINSYSAAPAIADDTASASWNPRTVLVAMPDPFPWTLGGLRGLTTARQEWTLQVTPSAHLTAH
jgi:hypothetical protein